MARLVVDPISRIEGHLRIEAEVDGGKITGARSFCTMWPGMEQVLVGRDPRDAWAFAQRLCGVCSAVHAYSSIRAVEDALQIEIPALAQAFRNLMIATQNVHDHAMHFYHLHALDWVNVPSALRADPGNTSRLARSISSWRNVSEAYFKEVLAKLGKFASAGQPGLFANGYWDHPAYKLPPEVNLLGVAHYLEALDWQQHVVRIFTLLGGKDPHPNFLVGGVPFAVNLSSPAAVNADVLAEIKSHIEAIQEFVREVYVPDLITVAGFYTEWLSIGAGVGNFLSCGEFPEGKTKDASGYFLPRGAIVGRNLADVRELEQEYSWRESPRWQGKPMEVGPLARMLIAYGRGHAGVKEKVDAVLERLDATPAALCSTLGRNAARGIEAWVLSEHLSAAYRRIIELVRAGDTCTFSAERWDPRTWPKSCRGSGQMEAPRGPLGHWVEIENQKIAKYRIVVPSTWNAEPGDAADQPGPYEAALAGTPVHKAEEPVEILRTVHSFDPCLACACRVRDALGRQIATVTVQ